MHKATRLADYQAEYNVIASMMTSQYVIEEAFGKLDDSCFDCPLAKAAFRHMKPFFEANREVNPAVVLDSMMLETDKVDTTAFWQMANMSLPSGVDYYIEKIAKMSKLRKLWSVVTRYTEKTNEKGADPDELMESLSNDMDKIIDAKNSGVRKFEDIILKDYSSSGVSYHDYVSEMVDKISRGEKLDHITPTGFPELDKKIFGLVDGYFTLIAARPGVGKTTFALNIIRRIASQGVPCLFFSLEMDADELSANILCQESEVSAFKMRSFQASSLEMNQIWGNANRVGKMPIIIDDNPNITVNQILARTKRLMKSDGVKAVFIDYVTLINTEIRFSNNQERIAYISKKLTAMAKTLKIPVVCLCQLNRESEKQERRPYAHDLRESGQLEQDAHVILMLHDTTSKEGESPDIRYLKVYIEKNRFGSKGVVNIDFIARTGVMNPGKTVEQLAQSVKENQTVVEEKKMRYQPENEDSSWAAFTPPG